MLEKAKAVMRRLENGEALTNGECYGTAVEAIQTKEEARQFFLALTRNHVERFGGTVAEAIVKEKANIGYYAGYYEPATAKRVYELFECAHPIFGTAFPSPDEAFRKGVELGQKAKEGGKC